MVKLSLGFELRVSEVNLAGSWVPGFGLITSGFGLGVSGFGFQCTSFGLRISGFGFEASSLGLRVWGFWLRALGLQGERWNMGQNNLIAANVYDKYSTGPSIRPICTRCCLTMNNVIQVCSNLR